MDNSPSSKQPEHEVQFKTTLNDECSLEETLKAAQQSIKISQQHKDKRLKEAEEACGILKTELQQQKNELLMWVDRWKHMKAKKDIYK